MDEINFSDSEDDDQKDKQPFELDEKNNEKNYTEEMTKINKLYEQNIEEGVDEGTINKYTGTRHEKINKKERKDYLMSFDVILDDK